MYTVKGGGTYCHGDVNGCVCCLRSVVFNVLSHQASEVRQGRRGRVRNIFQAAVLSVNTAKVLTHCLQDCPL